MTPEPTETQQKSIELMQQNAVSMANVLPEPITDDECIVYEFERKKYLNGRYGKGTQQIMTPEPQENQTTEERLKDIRASMRFFIPRQTFGREHGRISGWYYSEPVDSSRVERLTDGIVLGSRRV